MYIINIITVVCVYIYIYIYIYIYTYIYSHYCINWLASSVYVVYAIIILCVIILQNHLPAFTMCLIVSAP